jgi:hypothetical protein
MPASLPGHLGVAIARDLIDGRLPSEFAGEVADHAADAERGLGDVARHAHRPPP